VFVKPLQLLLSFSAIALATLFGTSKAEAQIHDPVAWDFALYDNGDGTLDLDFHAEIEAGWHVYSQFLNPFDGPIPTSFTIETEGVATADTAAAECEPHLEYDPNFMLDLLFFEEQTHWVHTVSFPGAIPDTIRGYLTFMVCDESKCLPPEDIDFALALADLKPETAKPDYCGSGNSEGHSGPFDSGSDEAPMGIYDPVQWEIALYATGDQSASLVATAEIEEGWHVYSNDNDPLDGPIPTSFTLSTEGVEAGDLQECTPEVHFDPNFDKDVKSFEGTVRWALDVSWSGDAPESVAGLLTYMTCDDTKCIFPPDVEFNIALADALNEAMPALCPDGDGAASDAGDGGEEGGDGLLVLFLLGMGLGFAALFTPCVFPLIPMTVSFFTKQSKTRAEGIRNALIYGASIIFIYTGLGLVLTAVFGVDVLNLISTDPYFNLFLFLLLIVFGVSFLGAFEIQLPTSWANKVDAQADRGGLIGIFFMAATLAIVSFSCTGPLVGSALAGAATGDFGGPIAVMFGFSLALAIPFALFSAFPGWLNSLPQSGGWLTSVKVVLGLLEIGFAFKFLSNADLVLQLGLLKRELFIAIWIAVALCIAVYLYGGLRFPHDSKLERLSVGRWSLGTVFLILAIYMVPGMWGAPLNLISGFPPPLFYAESAGSVNAGGHAAGGHTASGHVEARYRDYDEGLAAARAEGKPMILDFTGWACVNCRKMEEQVWPHPDVVRYLTEEAVLVSLYVDERKALPEAEQRVEQFGGKDFRVRTVGNKWTYLQASRFGTNAQPFYVMIDHDGEALGDGVGYDPDPQKFIDFLEAGFARFESSK
jgi:thiol:disulfide interchange protein DsbD